MLPLALGSLDHYTLIVEDAEAVASFHQNVLGFEPVGIQMVNAGSAPDGEYDMINHILNIPDTDGRVLVVTEGLNDRSIFTRYLKAHGPGVHHVAYEIDDLDEALAFLRTRGVKTTSSEILTDPITGLRQVFLDREHGGYFIELVERTPKSKPGSFTEENMARLAQTMETYIDEDEAALVGPTEDDLPQVAIRMPRADVAAFMVDPFNLPKWTAHRTIRRIEGRVVEVRMVGDVALEVSEHPTEPEVHYVWSRIGGEFRVRFAVQELTPRITRVKALLPELPPERAARTVPVVEAELSVLKALLEGQEQPITPEQEALLDDYHMEVYRRPGL